MSGWGHVWAAVEEFRAQYSYAKSDKLPVDVFSLVELDLKLDVIPFDDLFAKYGKDAALLPDFSGFYVDAEAYILWERGPVWKQNRLRFTVAHELGHFVLHRVEAAKIKYLTFANFVGIFKTQDGHRHSLEQEADEFAGRLLVPADRISGFYDKFAARAEIILPHWRNSGEIRQHFAENMSAHFGVHPQSILVRLDREGLWPSP